MIGSTCASHSRCCPIRANRVPPAGGWHLQPQEILRQPHGKSLRTAGSVIVRQGRIQKNDGTVSLRAERFWPVRDLITESESVTPSHDFR